MAGDLLVTNIGELSTPIGTSARRGAEMSELRVIEDAAVLIRGGLIVFAGPGADVPWEEADGVPPISADGRAAVPGFVDSHTHFVFAGYRDDEFIWRSQGMPYMEIHRRGGGIRRSMEATRAANLEQLVEIGERRLWTMLSMGVTTVEGKSGYGLDLQTELRQLEAMSILAERTPTAIVATYLGAHAGLPSSRVEDRNTSTMSSRRFCPPYALRVWPGFATCSAKKASSISKSRSAILKPPLRWEWDSRFMQTKSKAPAAPAWPPGCTRSAPITCSKPRRAT